MSVATELTGGGTACDGVVIQRHNWAVDSTTMIHALRPWDSHDLPILPSESVTRLGHLTGSSKDSFAPGTTRTDFAHASYLFAGTKFRLVGVVSKVCSGSPAELKG